MIKDFIIDKDLSFVLFFREKSITFFAQHGYLVDDNGALYNVATPYLEDDLNDLQFAQNGDVLYIFHKDYPTKTLSRYGNTDWRLEDFEFKSGPWSNVNTSETTLTISRTTDTARVKASAPVFTEKDVNRLIRLTVVDDTNTAWQAEKDVSSGDILYSDNKYYKAKSSGKTGTVKPVHSEGTRSDGSILFEYMHAGYGQGKISRYISETEVDVEIDGNMPETLVNKPTDYWELGLIYGGSENPMCGTFFRGRFCFMINDNGIPKVCLSCSDDYNNFADKDYGEVLATNAITVSITNAKYNAGRWLNSSNVLFVGTSSGEFYIDSATSSEPLAPDNVKTQIISEIGSLPITPMKIGAHTLFATETSIRDIVYSYANDSYDPIDLSLYGKHLFRSGIKDMKYQETPDKIAWFVVGNGNLIGLTFSSEQNVSAFHRHNIGGNVKSLAVIPNPNGLSDDLWIEVDRDGKTCIEWLDNGYPLISSDEIENNFDYFDRENKESEYYKNNSFYVDGGLSIDRTPNVSGTFFALSNNLLNREMVYFDADDSSEETPSKTLTSDDNTIDFVIDKFNNGEGYMTFQTAVKTDDSLTYNIRLSDNFVGCKIIVSGIFKDSQQGGFAKTFYNGTLESSDLSFEANTDGTTRYTFSTISIKVYSEIKSDDVSLDGLDHLEGKEVAIMVDGAEMQHQIVTNGTVTVPWYSKHISVGLPINSAYIPQNIYLQGNNSSGIGDVQRIDHVTLMLWRSMGGKIGSNSNNLRELYFRKTDDVMGESSDLYTGNKTIPLSFNTTTIKEKGATVMIQNDSVYPMNILAIAPHFSTSGNGL